MCNCMFVLSIYSIARDVHLYNSIFLTILDIVVVAVDTSIKFGIIQKETIANLSASQAPLIPIL
jgi:hypothetical protein